jgi:AsnC-like helix-turn-helix protein
MAGGVDYVLRVVVADMNSYDLFYKKQLGAIALKQCDFTFRDGKNQVGNRPARRSSKRVDPSRSIHVCRHRLTKSAISCRASVASGNNPRKACQT